MDYQMKPFTANEACVILQRILRSTSFMTLESIPKHYKDGLVATHEKLIIPAISIDTGTRMFDIQVHVKFQPKEREHIAKFSIGESVFWKEINFYEMIYPCIIEKYKYDKYMANCIVTTGGRLVFEDVVKKGYSKRNIYDNYNSLKIAITSLARFHCGTIVAEAQMTQNFRKETTMLDRYETSFDEMMFNDGWSTISKWYNVGIELTCILANKLCNINIQELRTALLRVNNLAKTSQKHRNVICHGDLRKDNMMFLVKDGREIKCLFINFYMIRYAPPALDVLQLLYIHTSKAFRSLWEKDILKIYQAQLARTTRYYNSLPRNLVFKIPSLEKVREAYSELRLFGAAIAVVYLSLSLMTEVNALDFIKNPVTPAEFLNPDLIDFCSLQLTTNERLLEQFCELANEVMTLCKEYDRRSIWSMIEKDVSGGND